MDRARGHRSGAGSLGHGAPGLQGDAPLTGHGEHGGVVQEVLELHHGLQYPPEVVGAHEAGGAQPAHGVDVDGEAPLPELEARHLAAGEAADELLVHVPERDHGRPQLVHGRLHGLRLEHEEHHLGLLGAEAERERVPRLVRQDGEAGGHVGGGGRERQALQLAQERRRDVQQPEQLQRRRATHRERLDDELPAEADALHVAARLEARLRRRRRAAGLVLLLLVLLLVLAVLVLLLLLCHGDGWRAAPLLCFPCSRCRCWSELCCWGKGRNEEPHRHLPSLRCASSCSGCWYDHTAKFLVRVKDHPLHHLDIIQDKLD
ncbi:hypothetical protein CFC21_002931 [Triticum aestivum]|uniref:Uncharacterized protein n=1 Tax=Triticum aestivum TaxID=4565 RepID=A0A3B5Y3K5_WHEAT|nr:hypothetical protein CFC21_002931 [Triticum aestivum]